MAHNYAGNVRELRNLVERAVVLARGPLVTVEDLPALSASRPSDDWFLAELLELPLDQAVRSLERRMIVGALERCNGNKTEAARVLGIHRQLLYSKIRELGVE